MIGRPELPIKDAAASLCAMMRHAIVQGQGSNNLPNPMVWSSSYSDLKQPNIVEDCESHASNCRGGAFCQQTRKGKLPPKMKHRNKLKEFARDSSVSYDEMKRLMRVYGPTKCVRSRSPKESANCAKILSVKRKFYRWFPDFHERFGLAPGGWYKPKIGHEREVEYREGLRKKDQVILVAKRNARRKKSKTEPAPL